MKTNTVKIIDATNDLETQKDKLIKRQARLDKAQLDYDAAIAKGEADTDVEPGLYHSFYEDRTEFAAQHAVRITVSNGGSTVVVEYEEGMFLN